jgi:peptidoglycan/LPS O-acetylase OafA/YrhL
VPPREFAARSDIATRDRLPSLTGLRFWAALLVVLYHLTTQVGAIQPVSALVMYGRTGVTFFFVLSGFVLAWTYGDKPIPVAVFLWRRFARLWPLVAVTGVLSLLAYALIGTPIVWHKAASTFVFMQAWRISWAGGANPAAWSLSDEAFFYVLFPLILIVAATRARRRLLWIACAIALPVVWLCYVYYGWSGWRLDYFPVSRLLQFVIGALCGLAASRGVRGPVRYWPAVGLVVLFHAALIPWHLLVPDTSRLGPFSGSEWFATPVFALLIMAAAAHDRDGLRTGVKGPWALRLGHWSFAVYLVQEIVIRMWVHFLGRPEALVCRAAVWVALLAVTVAVAGALYSLVEHPAERWLRRHGPQVAPVPERSTLQPDRR